MNRRGFLSVLGLAPVVGVMAARDAMASPSVSRTIAVEWKNLTLGEAFIGERVGESTSFENFRIRKIFDVPQKFGVDKNGNDLVAILRSPQTEDASVSAQFESDLAFLRDEPGVAI